MAPKQLCYFYVCNSIGFSAYITKLYGSGMPVLLLFDVSGDDTSRLNLGNWVAFRGSDVPGILWGGRGAVANQPMRGMVRVPRARRFFIMDPGMRNFYRPNFSISGFDQAWIASNVDFNLIILFSRKTVTEKRGFTSIPGGVHHWLSGLGHGCYWWSWWK